MISAASVVFAKGSSGVGKCNNPLSCPIVLPSSSGIQVDELVNPFTTAFVLGVAYSVQSLPAQELMSFTLSGPGSGANTLPFLASATLQVSGATSFSLGHSNYDSSGTGSAYLQPVSLSQGGITVTESVSGFEGEISIQAVNRSGAPIALTLDLTIPVERQGQVTVTNLFAVSAVPEVPVALMLLAGFVPLASVAHWKRARTRGRRFESLNPSL